MFITFNVEIRSSSTNVHKQNNHRRVHGKATKKCITAALSAVRKSVSRTRLHHTFAILVHSRPEKLLASLVKGAIASIVGTNWVGRKATRTTLHKEEGTIRRLMYLVSC